MKLHTYTFLGSFAAALAVLAGCGNKAGNKATAAVREENFNLNWAAHNFWDDGLAEVATYTALRTVYGMQRSFDYTLITVKEDFNEAFNVKTDDYGRKDLFPVMKVNAFCRIPTDNYPYHYLTSAFFKRENATQIHKLTTSSQEWCGNTFKALNHQDNKYLFAYNTYWDNQGEGKTTLPGNILFEDQLPYTLRSLRFKNNQTFILPVAELLQTNKANIPYVYEATFTITSLNSTAGSLWQVQVQLAPDKLNFYTFKKEYPHLMVSQKTWDGRTLQLSEVKRYAYWEH